MDEERIDLTRIDLGRDDAESDTNLEHYFLKTPEWEMAKTGQKQLIIGRKGSGKTAIFRLLKNEQGNEVAVVDLSPSAYAWGVLKAYEQFGIPPEHATTSAWVLTLCVSLYSYLAKNGLPSGLPDADKIDRFICDNFSADPSFGFQQVAQRLLLGYADIDFSAFGIKSVGQKTGTPFPQVVDVLKQTAALIANSQQPRYVLILDQLDDCWDGTAQSSYILIGLIKASQQLNQLGPKISVMPFIRSDIYDSLVFSDKDKVRQDELRLRWTQPEELRNLIGSRIKYSLELPWTADACWSATFADEKYRGSSSALKWITDRTFFRPRDMISFCRFAIEAAIKAGHELVMKDDCHRAFHESFSPAKLDDLVIEYRNHIRTVREALNCLYGREHRLSRESVVALFDDYSKRNDDSRSGSAWVKELFKMGVLGVKKVGGADINMKGGSRFVYSHHDPNVELLNYDEYYIHPSLRPALSIKEARAGKAGDEEDGDEGLFEGDGST